METLPFALAGAAGAAAEEEEDEGASDFLAFFLAKASSATAGSCRYGQPLSFFLQKPLLFQLWQGYTRRVRAELGSSAPTTT